ncbi:hypothetical protein [Rhizohabitans arisaemae]|uniref:hypothetical protein n=1 Tax=Rhizohabitans arisaemae TaxID=2720610 RepID=UPI0024B104DC|nr:hypothetical protein [Rhizohabitans arisaemae]
MDGGIILLIFLALLACWLVNKVARFFRLPKVGYAGIIIVFVLVMLALWGQTFDR